MVFAVQGGFCRDSEFDVLCWKWRKRAAVLCIESIIVLKTISRLLSSRSFHIIIYYHRFVHLQTSLGSDWLRDIRR
jgi:hypothetical protein